MSENLWDDVPTKDTSEQAAQKPEASAKNEVSTPTPNPKAAVSTSKQEVSAPAAVKPSSKPDPSRWAKFYNRT